MNFTPGQSSFLKKEIVELSFGTSGLRGLVGDMTDLECYINTKAFIGYLIGIKDISRGDTICIGGDLRPSTARIMAAVTMAIEHSGCKPDNCGLIPTPALAFYAIQNAHASIMVTGSHISVDRNGIKFYKHDGEILKVDEPGITAQVSKVRQEEAMLSPNESLFDGNGKFKQPSSVGKINDQAKEAYIHRYIDIFPSDCFSTKTIVLYQHSSVGRDILGYILQCLGAEVIPVKRSSKFIAVDTENITSNDKDLFKSLADKYKHRGIFAIISTDGDGDRPVVADENGNLYRGDVLGIIACEYLNAQFAVVPISANDSVSIQLGKNGVTLKQTKIGSPYVIEAMNQAITSRKSLVVGWETNGGFLTGTDFTINGNTLKSLPTRDSCLPIICALAQAIKRNISISQLFSGLPRRYSDAGLIDNFPLELSQKIMKHLSPPEENNIQQVNFEVGDIVAINVYGDHRRLDSRNSVFELVLRTKGELQRYFTSRLGFDSIACINFTDGIRITFANGDLAHIRPSGNAPQIRIYSNANSQERAREIAQLCVTEPNGIIQQMARDLVK